MKIPIVLILSLCILCLTACSPSTPPKGNRADKFEVSAVEEQSLNLSKPSEPVEEEDSSRTHTPRSFIIANDIPVISAENDTRPLSAEWDKGTTAMEIGNYEFSVPSSYAFQKAGDYDYSITTFDEQSQEEEDETEEEEWAEEEEILPDSMIIYPAEGKGIITIKLIETNDALKYLPETIYSVVDGVKGKDGEILQDVRVYHLESEQDLYFAIVRNTLDQIQALTYVAMVFQEDNLLVLTLSTTEEAECNNSADYVQILKSLEYYD